MTDLFLFAVREHYLEKIAIYLSRCGLQSNSELLEKGYPDLGWDPVEGERYLDFLRFCVWVNGKFGVYYIMYNYKIYRTVDSLKKFVAL